MTTMIAYCGLCCTECDAYKATQSGDAERIEATAAKWRELFSPYITAENILCDGCKSNDGWLTGYCAFCKVRSCAIEKAVPNCAHCADYGQCDIIAEFLEHAPEAKARLDSLHQQRASH